ncbi:C-type lectin [Aphelenchoides avenae]|nr:C-type lectin [Aphelenchus avenae]
MAHDDSARVYRLGRRQRSNQKSNDYVLELANDTLGRREPYYIGFQRTSDDWQWVDGSVADFVYWAEGEPNGHIDGEQCTEVWGGGVDHAWNDLKCSTRLPIVCQKNAYEVGILEPG